MNGRGALGGVVGHYATLQPTSSYFRTVSIHGSDLSAISSFPVLYFFLSLFFPLFFSVSGTLVEIETSKRARPFRLKRTVRRIFRISSSSTQLTLSRPLSWFRRLGNAATIKPPRLMGSVLFRDVPSDWRVSKQRGLLLFRERRGDSTTRIKRRCSNIDDADVLWLFTFLYESRSLWGCFVCNVLELTCLSAKPTRFRSTRFLHYAL